LPLRLERPSWRSEAGSKYTVKGSSHDGLSAKEEGPSVDVVMEE